MFSLQLCLIVALSLLFCSLYVFIKFMKEDDDTEDSYGYLEMMMNEEVKT